MPRFPNKFYQKFNKTYICPKTPFYRSFLHKIYRNFMEILTLKIPIKITNFVLCRKVQFYV